MDAWLDTARGPLFTFAFLVMVLGLARHVLLQVALLVAKGRTLRRVRWKVVAADTLSWAFPVRHLVPGTVLFSLASFAFHAGAILVPLFLADHIVLWERFSGLDLPALGRGAADVLTGVVLVCVPILFAHRLLVPRARALSRRSDYVVLLLVFLPFASGGLAAHPAANPLPWNAMMLVHVLSAEALFLAVPFTKLAHVVLFPFNRISQIHWQLQPGAGEKAAAALFGEEAKV